MERKVLNMHDPVISAYTPYGSLFSIMHDKMWPWVFNNFIQIRYAPQWEMYAFEDHNFILSHCPEFNTYLIPQNLITAKWNKSIKEFIVDLINSDFYLFLYVDRYYISKAPCYMNRHHPHQVFVYGYDLEKDTVCIADNLQFGKFIRTECSFEEAEKGYWSIKGEHTYLNEVRILQLKDENDATSTRSFDLEYVLMGLDNYLHSKRVVDIYGEQKCVYGFNANYRLLEELYNYSLTQAKYIDIRAFHLLYEHKLLMDMRVKYMVQNGYLTDNFNLVQDFSKLKNDYLVLRNEVIKYDFGNSPKIMVEIINKLEQNLSTEKNLIIKLIELLS